MNNSSLTSKYIRVKSGKRLREENRSSLQGLFIAGSNDSENQPGATGIMTPLISLTGVSQPNTIDTNVQFGETLSVQAGGMGNGAVDSPLLVPRKALTSRILVYPYSYTSRWRQQNLLADPPLSDLTRSNVTNNAGTITHNPSATTASGAVREDLDRTVGKDPKRVERLRNRRRHQNEF